MNKYILLPLVLSFSFLCFGMEEIKENFYAKIFSTMPMAAAVIQGELTGLNEQIKNTGSKLSEQIKDTTLELGNQIKNKIITLFHIKQGTNYAFNSINSSPHYVFGLLTHLENTAQKTEQGVVVDFRPLEKHIITNDASKNVETYHKCKSESKSDFAIAGTVCLAVGTAFGWMAHKFFNR